MSAIREMSGVLGTGGDKNRWVAVYEQERAVQIVCEAGTRLTPAQARRLALQLVDTAARIEQRMLPTPDTESDEAEK